jgi:hypothetical protein
MDQSDDVNEVEWLAALEVSDPAKAVQEYAAYCLSACLPHR